MNQQADEGLPNEEEQVTNDEIHLNSRLEHDEDTSAQKQSPQASEACQQSVKQETPLDFKSNCNNSLNNDLKVESIVGRKREGSIVNFNEQCDLYEIDLESAGTTTKSPKKPPIVLSVRYYIMLLALFSPFIVTYSKTIINFAIIDMIDPNYSIRKPSAEYFATTSTTNTPISLLDAIRTKSNEREETKSLAYFDLDHSCPVSEKDRARLLNQLENDQKLASNNQGEKFEWDTDTQGLLKAAYSIGHILLQVAGGRLSEIYGSRVIMSLVAWFIAFACLLAPFLASIHFSLLFSDLFILGILGSFMTPSLITLVSNWLTPSEKSLMISFHLVSSRLGFALSSLFCGVLIDAQLSWRYLFYSAGWVSLTFGSLFYFVSRNRPNEHPLMGQAELDYLASKNTLVREHLARLKARSSPGMALQPVEVVSSDAKPGAASNEKHAPVEAQKVCQKTNEDAPKNSKRQAAPWFAILTNVPVWAFIVTKFCVKLMADTVQTELPVYLKRVMHMESKYNGYINSANYIIFCISCIVIGTASKIFNKKRPLGLSKTAIRKIFQCTASFGVSIILLCISLSVCNELLTLGLFMLMFLMTTFSTGGEAQIPIDLSERYAGTIHAIGSSLAISGAIEPIMVGQFLLGHGADKDRWAKIWLIASGISFMGGLIFLVFGEAEIQPFDRIESNNSGANGSHKDKDKQSLEKDFVVGAERDTKRAKKVNLRTSSPLTISARVNESFIPDEATQNNADLKEGDLPEEKSGENFNNETDLPSYKESAQI